MSDDPEPTLENTRAAFRATWALFTAIEESDNEGIEAIWEQHTDSEFLRGWHVVAARLRQVVQEHAESVGCGCGSDAWLEHERLHNLGIGN